MHDDTSQEIHEDDIKAVHVAIGSLREEDKQLRDQLETLQAEFHDYHLAVEHMIDDIVRNRITEYYQSVQKTIEMAVQGHIEELGRKYASRISIFPPISPITPQAGPSVYSQPLPTMLPLSGPENAYATLEAPPQVAPPPEIILGTPSSTTRAIEMTSPRYQDNVMGPQQAYISPQHTAPSSPYRDHPVPQSPHLSSVLTTIGTTSRLRSPLPFSGSITACSQEQSISAAMRSSSTSEVHLERGAASSNVSPTAMSDIRISPMAPSLREDKNRALRSTPDASD